MKNQITPSSEKEFIRSLTLEDVDVAQALLCHIYSTTLGGLLESERDEKIVTKFAKEQADIINDGFLEGLDQEKLDWFMLGVYYDTVRKICPKREN